MSEKISFLSLNIGNPSVERAKKQCDWLDKRSEDIFVLTEAKVSQGCLYIAEHFQQYGYDLFTMNSSVEYSVFYPKSNTGDLGVMIISKYPIKKKLSFFSDDSIYFSRQAESIILSETMQLNVMGLYVPSRDRSEWKIERKKKFVEEIQKFLMNSDNNKKIIMGDLNILERTHRPHYSTYFDWEYDFYDTIIKSGYIDAFKYCSPDIQEYSWVGRTNDGYRYDYCFISSDLEKSILKCNYVHETRNIRITDHSAITMEIEL